MTAAQGSNSSRLHRRKLLHQFGGSAAVLGVLASGAGEAIAQSPPQILGIPVGPSGAPPATTSPGTSTLTDADILNFALNLEYLEAEFYLRAVFGKGLTPDEVTGTGTAGDVSGGQAVPFNNRAIVQFAEEIALDERNHVLFLRLALGASAVARPQIDLDKSFTALARAAGLIGHDERFSPFESTESFLLGAYVFEDVGVTAYHGAAAAISNKQYLTAAAGILAVEAYHASEIRTLLYQKHQFAATQAISNLRAELSGTGPGTNQPPDDQGIKLDGKANIVPADSNSIAFARTPQQVLNIVYGGSPGGGGFFPNKLNGVIS